MGPRLSRRLSPILAGCLTLPAGCLHVRSHETAQLELAEGELPPLKTLTAGALSVEHVVFTPSQWPLEGFFSQLAAGEFSAALHEINLRYEPAASDNAALAELLDAGFVPVYVRVTNRGTTQAAFDAAHLQLAAGDGRYQAIAADALPQELKSFNTKAVAANVYNLVMAVVVVAVVIVVAASTDAHAFSGNNFSSGDGSGGGSVLNRTTKTTTVDYQSYLLQPTVLAPGASASGLVFFRAEGPVVWDDLRLKVSG